MTSGAHAGDGVGASPRFTIVTAVWNVAPYLEEFIDSIDKQTFDLSRIEIIAVDDGSTDGSSELLAQWAKRRPNLVRIVTQPNAGQGAARNVALEQARGEWLTFPDPDDILQPDYFAEVDAFLRRHPDTMLAGTNRLLFQESAATIRDNHPMRDMYRPGNRMVDIDRFPDVAQNSAATGFFRTDVVQATGVRFDSRIRPVFEDGHFCIIYLLAAPNRNVGLIRTANYVYRKRADGSSTLQQSLGDSGRYTAVPQYGYLDVLRRSVTASGYPPEWVQNMVLYDLSYYFSADLEMAGASGPRGAVADTFVAHLREIVTLLDPAVLNAYRFKRFDRLWIDILQHGLNESDWHTPYAVIQNRDARRREVRIAYRYVGRPPTERFISDGVEVDVIDGKVRAQDFFDRTLMRERVAWVPLRSTLRLELDGVPVPIRTAWEPPHAITAQAADVYAVLPSAKPPKPPVGVGGRIVRGLAKSWPATRRYRDAWVLMDRIHDADDNAERLWEYLRAERSDINAWFVLEKGTVDWRRLRRTSGRRRMIAHGSLRWKLAMLNAAHLISSHADAAVQDPDAIRRLTPQRWRFTFLQHGVTKDDLSRWLNPKHLDVIVTSTPAEQASVAGDDTTYSATSREARMTGLARFDRLIRLGSQVPAAERRWILVCPTWRHWLVPPPAAGDQRYTVSDAFTDSDYAKQWTALLSDEQLAVTAAEHNLRIGFLPHPNVQPALSRMALPPHVAPLSFSGTDVQQLFAESALVITDYSSMFFNAAYLDRPVVHFQFDADRLLGHEHVGRPGYFDYARDGFGPVTTTVTQASAAAIEIIADGCRPAPEYQKRIDEAFPDRDGRCCERITSAIESLPPMPLPPPAIRMAITATRRNTIARMRRSSLIQKVVRSDRGRHFVRSLKRRRRS